MFSRDILTLVVIEICTVSVVLVILERINHKNKNKG